LLLFCACWEVSRTLFLGEPKPLAKLNKGVFTWRTLLHKAAAKALRAYAVEGGKLPNPAALQAEYTRLTEKKNALHSEYGKLRQMAKEYGVVKKNVDNILNPSAERIQLKERGAELG